VEYDAEDIKIEPYCLHVWSVGMDTAAIGIWPSRDRRCATSEIDRLTVGQKYNVFELRELVIGWTGSNIAGIPSRRISTATGATWGRMPTSSPFSTKEIRRWRVSSTTD
jgi:hypothetical protein